MNRRMLMLLAGLPLLAACGDPGPPFDLWDHRIGMSFAALDSMAAHDQGDHYTCVPVHDVYQRCGLVTQGIEGEMDVVLDSAERVVQVVFKPRLVNPVPAQIARASTQGRALAADWSRVVDPEVEDMPGGPIQQWRSKDGRWSARIVWLGNTPSQISITDERGVAGYRFAESMDPSQPAIMTNDFLSPPPVATTPEEHPTQSEVYAALRELAQGQASFRNRFSRYAGRPAQAGVYPPEGIRIEIVEATATAWRARAVAANGRECRVWGGADPPWAFMWNTGSTEGFPVCR